MFLAIQLAPLTQEQDFLIPVPELLVGCCHQKHNVILRVEEVCLKTGLKNNAESV
tara:strand:+ start:331 stop:495 length:165 start_codon:yes stop_codon:yes gene_type:complete